MKVDSQNLLNRLLKLFVSKNTHESMFLPLCVWHRVKEGCAVQTTQDSIGGCVIFHFDVFCEVLQNRNHVLMLNCIMKRG
jgi:hypothetical protein